LQEIVPKPFSLLGLIFEFRNVMVVEKMN
jgi:hypothetical protein